MQRFFLRDLPADGDTSTRLACDLLTNLTYYGGSAPSGRIEAILAAGDLPPNVTLRGRYGDRAALVNTDGATVYAFEIETGRTGLLITVGSGFDTLVVWAAAICNHEIYATWPGSPGVVVRQVNPGEFESFDLRRVGLRHELRLAMLSPEPAQDITVLESGAKPELHPLLCLGGPFEIIESDLFMEPWQLMLRLLRAVDEMPTCDGVLLGPGTYPAAFLALLAAFTNRPDWPMTWYVPAAPATDGPDFAQLNPLAAPDGITLLEGAVLIPTWAATASEHPEHHIP